MSKDVVAFVIGIHEVKKGTGWVETVRLSKKEQAEIGNRTKVGNNKDIIRFKVRVRKVRQLRQLSAKCLKNLKSLMQIFKIEREKI